MTQSQGSWPSARWFLPTELRKIICFPIMPELPKRVPFALENTNTLRKGIKSLRVACGILAALTSPAAFAQQKIDTVVTNGKILTVDKDFRVVEALAIQQRSYRRTRHDCGGGALCREKIVF